MTAAPFSGMGETFLNGSIAFVFLQFLRQLPFYLANARSWKVLEKPALYFLIKAVRNRDRTSGIAMSWLCFLFRGFKHLVRGATNKYFFCYGFPYLVCLFQLRGLQKNPIWTRLLFFNLEVYLAEARIKKSTPLYSSSLVFIALLRSKRDAWHIHRI